MTPEALKELFKPFGEVAVKRMFGGAGVYAEGLCFAIEQGGEVFLKADELSQQSFAEAGSSPFIYVARGKPMTDVFLAPAADRLRRGRRTAPLGVAWTGGSAARGRSQGEAEGEKACQGQGESLSVPARLCRRRRWPGQPRSAVAATDDSLFRFDRLARRPGARLDRAKEEVGHMVAEADHRRVLFAARTLPARRGLGE